MIGLILGYIFGSMTTCSIAAHLIGEEADEYVPLFLPIALFWPLVILLYLAYRFGKIIASKIDQ